MPSPSFHARFQPAVLWRRVGTDDNGPVVSDTAEELEVGWQDGYREVTGPDGQPVSVDATVYGLADELPVGSAMVKGTIASLEGAGQTPLRQVFRVVVCDKMPDVTGRRFDIEAHLMRSSDRLPAAGSAT